MEYGIREVSELAGVSARTLRYYDEIGLLKPSRVTEAGYRFYGDKEVALLQQILFYRERNFELKDIQRILYQEDFDVMHALEEHLADLENQRARMDALIRTVKQTIQSMKGEIRMSDQEKFRAFQEKLVQENEARYGAEVRQKYGDEQADASNRKMLDMSEAEWKEFQALEKEIAERLQEGAAQGISPESAEAEAIVRLHEQWLCKAWKQYTPQAHKGVAQLYLADQRFTAYYDREEKGCARLLERAICFWADKI